MKACNKNTTLLCYGMTVKTEIMKCMMNSGCSCLGDLPKKKTGLKARVCVCVRTHVWLKDIIF